MWVNLHFLRKCCGFRNPHGKVGARRKASGSIRVRGHLSCVKEDLGFARRRAVRERAVVSSPPGVTQLQERFSTCATGGATGVVCAAVVAGKGTVPPWIRHKSVAVVHLSPRAQCAGGQREWSRRCPAAASSRRGCGPPLGGQMISQRR